MPLSFDRGLVEAFLETINSTNFQIVARGADFEGANTPTIKVETKHLTEKPRKEVLSYPNGRLLGGQKRQFSLAVNFARGGDYLASLDSLLHPDSYFHQVEIKTLQSVDNPEAFGQMANPFAELEPLVWRRDIETGIFAGHEGARPEVGRPGFNGNLVSVDMPDYMINALKLEAGYREIKRAELVRRLIAEALKLEYPLPPLEKTK